MIIEDMLDRDVKLLVDAVSSVMLRRGAELSVKNRVYKVLVSPLRGPEEFLETIVEFEAEKVEVEPNKVFIYLDDGPSCDMKVEFGDKAKVYVDFKIIEVGGLTVEVQGYHVRLKVKKEVSRSEEGQGPV